MNAKSPTTQELLDMVAALQAQVQELKAKPTKLVRSKLFVNGPSANPKAPTHSGTVDLPDGSAWHAVGWTQDDGSIVLRFQSEQDHLAERAAWKAQHAA